jgi:hypothetical protein
LFVYGRGKPVEDVTVVAPPNAASKDQLDYFFGFFFLKLIVPCSLFRTDDQDVK